MTPGSFKRNSTGPLEPGNLERAVRVVSEQAAAADGLVHEALDTGLGGFHPVILHAKTLG